MTVHVDDQSRGFEGRQAGAEGDVAAARPDGQGLTPEAAALVRRIIEELGLTDAPLERFTEAQKPLRAFVLDRFIVLEMEEIDRLLTLIEKVDDEKCPAIFGAWERARDNGFLSSRRSGAFQVLKTIVKNKGGISEEPPHLPAV